MPTMEDALATTVTSGMNLETILRYYQTDQYKKDELSMTDMLVDLRKIAEILLEG